MKKTMAVAASLLLMIYACKHEIPVQLVDPGNPVVPVPPAQVSCSSDTTYFQQQVLPIFISNCSMSSCHDAATHQGGINLTTYTGIMEEIEPYNLGNSKIWEKINENNASDLMPPLPMNPLSAAQKDIIRKWILQGAKNNSCQPTTCDTANVTYAVNIRNIISAKCQGCHSSANPGNGYDLTQYAVVKSRVTDGKLWGTINHLAGYSPMPKNGNKLSDCEINQFRKWIDAGAPNN